jgi:hypothetical protein
MQPSMDRLRGGRGAGAVGLLLIVALVAALLLLPLAVALLLGVLFALVGVVLFRHPMVRNASLLVMSLMVGLAGFEIAFGLIDAPPDRGVAKVHTPAKWSPYHPELGYRPLAGAAVDALATFGDKVVYHQTYTIEPSGARKTPGSAPHGPTYLFIGDSFIFGEGLADTETLPSQFAQGLKSKAHVVNLGVLGYGPNHLVRAMETGLYDSYVVGKVEAVITWIIPDQLLRVTGDGGWLTFSPR